MATEEEGKQVRSICSFSRLWGGETSSLTERSDERNSWLLSRARLGEELFGGGAFGRTNCLMGMAECIVA